MTIRVDSRRFRGFHSPDRQEEAAHGGYLRRPDDLGVCGWQNSSRGRGVQRPVGVTICRTCCCESPCCRSVEECCRFPPLFFCIMFEGLTRVVTCPACDECGNGASESARKGCDGDSAEECWRNAGRGAGGSDCVTSGAACWKYPILEHLVRLRIMDSKGGDAADSPAPSTSIVAQPAPHLAEAPPQTYATASGETREAQFLFALELFERDSRARINKPMVGAVINREHNQRGDYCASGAAAFEHGWGEELWRQDPLLSCCVSAVHCLTRLLHATRVSNSLTSAWSTRKRSNELAGRSSLWHWRAAAGQAKGKYCAKKLGGLKEGTMLLLPRVCG